MRLPKGWCAALAFAYGAQLQRDLRPLLDRINKGEIDPSFVITQEMPFADARKGYEPFRKKEDGCIKVVLKP